MPVKKAKKTKVSREVSAKAKEVLEFARQKAKECADSFQLHNLLFESTGKASVLFPTEAEREAYSRTPESRQISALMNTLPTPEPKGVVYFRERVDADSSVRLPPALHAALSAEAKAKGISLEQLCVSKLEVQLREAV